MNRMTAGDEVQGRRAEACSSRRPPRDLVPAQDPRAGRTRWASPCRFISGLGGRRETSSTTSCCQPTARTRGLLNPRAITQLMRKESAFGRRLWGLLSLELWLREFIDGARPQLVPPNFAVAPATGAKV